MSLRSVLFMASEVECVVFMNRCVSRKLGTQMQVEINKLQISRESQRVKPGLYRETPGIQKNRAMEEMHG